MSDWRFLFSAAVALAFTGCSNVPVSLPEPAAGTREFEVSRVGIERATSYALSAPAGSIRHIALGIAPEISGAAQSRWINIGFGTVREQSKSETCRDVPSCITVDKLASLVVYDSRSVERGGQPEASIHRFASMAEVDAWYAKDPIFEVSSASRRQAPLFAEIAPTARDVRDGHGWDWEVVHASRTAFDDNAFCGLLLDGAADQRCVAFADMRNLTLIGPELPGQPFPATSAGVKAMLADAATRGARYVGFERRVRGGGGSAVVLPMVSEVSDNRVCGLIANMPDAAKVRCFSLGEITAVYIIEVDTRINDLYPSSWSNPDLWGAKQPFSVTGSASRIKPLKPHAPIRDLVRVASADTFVMPAWIYDDDCPFCLY